VRGFEEKGLKLFGTLNHYLSMGRKRKNPSDDKSDNNSEQNVQTKAACTSIEYMSCQKLIYLLKNFEHLGLNKKSIHGFDGIVPSTGIKTLYEELAGSLICSPESWPYASHKVEYNKSKLGIGRIIPQSLSYIFMQRQIRYTIADDMYVDIDFVNCQPFIYRYLCQHYDISKRVYKCIDTYINERDDMIKIALQINGDKCRDDIKEWFLRIINGGNLDSSINETLGMLSFSQDMKILQQELIIKIEQDSKYKSLRKYILDKNGTNVFNTDCKIISLVLLDYENRMREALKTYVKSKKFDWSVECFDGGMSYIKANSKDILSIDWDDASEYVEEETGIRCPIKAKNMSDNVIQIKKEDLDKITFNDYLYYKYKHGTDYESVKHRFEINNFFASDEVVYYYEDSQTIKQYTKTDFVNKYENIWYMGVDKDGNPAKLKFINTWMGDELKRSYNLVGLYPPGCEDIPTNPNDVSDKNYVYSKWKGFRVEHIKADGKDYSSEVDVLRHHTLYLCNGDEEYRSFMEKFIKHILCFPGKKTDLVLAFKAIQGGEGKNTWFEIHKEMFGSQYCTSTQNPERDWFGDFNEILKDKIWIHMEEMSKDILRRHQKQFLGYITSKTDSINLKGGKKVVIPSYCNYFVTFNSQGLDMFPGLRRRIWVHEMNIDTVILQREYYDNLYTLMKQPQVIRAYYDWLMNNIDISNFKASENRPITPYMEKLFAKDETPRDRVEQFIQDKFIEYFGNTMHPNKNQIRLMDWYVEYKERLKQDNALQYLLSIQRFSGRIVELFGINDGVEKKINKGVSILKYDVDCVIQSMAKRNWFKLSDLGSEEQYMDMMYHQIIPCLKSCSDAHTTGEISHHLAYEIRAYKYFQGLEVQEFNHTCKCGGVYKLTRVEF